MDFDQLHLNHYDTNSPLYKEFGTKFTNTSNVEEKTSWLHSQVIGKDVEFDTPFGKRPVTYADHTASGRSLKCIENYIIKEVLPFYGNTHTDDSYVGSKTNKTSHKASEYIKKCMGGGEDDAIIFCGSGATSAIKRLQEVMGIAVPSSMRDRMIESLKHEERWVVFVGPYEHHSNLLSWRQTSAEVVEIGFDDNGLVDMEALELHLASSRFGNRPMIGSFSACSNVTGIITDTRAIARLLHQYGAFACFDFASSGAYADIDMRSGDIDGYDAVFVSPHKFLGGPGTPGILLMHKALYQLKSLPPSTCAGGTVYYVNFISEKDTIYFDEIEEREDGGTPPIIQKVRASLAFWVKEYISHEVINLHEQYYSETALARLMINPSIRVLGNTAVKRLPIISFLLFPPIDSSNDNAKNKKFLEGRFVTKLLNDLFGIQARGGCACAGPYGHHLLGIDSELSLRIRSAIKKGYIGAKPGWCRISFTYYSSKEEFSFILSAIEFVAMYGHRFIPLYQHDWITGDWFFRKRSLFHLMNDELAHFSPSYSSEENYNVGVKRERPGAPSSRNKKEKAVHRYSSYLESARFLALSLPEHSNPGPIPEDIDPDIVLFRF